MTEKTTRTPYSLRALGIYAASLLLILAAVACVTRQSCASCSTERGDKQWLPDPRPIVEVHGISIKPEVIQLTPSLSFEVPPSMRFIGTGWFISTDHKGSVVATAGHVCEGEAAFKVIDNRGMDFPATKVYYDEDADVCLLHVSSGDRRTFRVTGWDSADIPFGLPIWYVGFPQEHRVAFDGRVSGIKDGTGQGGDSIILSLPVNPGASGAPVIYRGRVVSMAVRFYTVFHSLSYGVAPEDLRRAQMRADNILWRARRTNTEPTGI